MIGSDRLQDACWLVGQAFVYVLGRISVVSRIAALAAARKDSNKMAGSGGTMTRAGKLWLAEVHMKLLWLAETVDRDP